MLSANPISVPLAQLSKHVRAIGPPIHFNFPFFLPSFLTSPSTPFIFEVTSDWPIYRVTSRVRDYILFT